METQIEIPTFDEVKQLYKDMLKERARDKYRIWDREYKKRRYDAEPEFRAKRLASTKAQRDRKKAEQLAKV